MGVPHNAWDRLIFLAASPGSQGPKQVKLLLVKLLQVSVLGHSVWVNKNLDKVVRKLFFLYRGNTTTLLYRRPPWTQLICGLPLPLNTLLR